MYGNVPIVTILSVGMQMMFVYDSRKLSLNVKESFFFFFQFASGAFLHIKDTVLSALSREPTVDISPDTVGTLSLIMLAQAQEVFFLKATRGNSNFFFTALHVKTSARLLYQDSDWNTQHVLGRQDAKRSLGSGAHFRGSYLEEDRKLHVAVAGALPEGWLWDPCIIRLVKNGFFKNSVQV